MKILKNVLIGAGIGQLVGLLVCLIGGLWALNMPSADLSARIVSSLAWILGVVAVSIASAKLSDSSILCAALSGALYAATCLTVGLFLDGGEGIGVLELLMMLFCLLCPVLLCITGVTVLGKRKRRRNIHKKVFK